MNKQQMTDKLTGNGWNIIKSNEYGNGYSVVFKTIKKTFSIDVCEGLIRIYTAFVEQNGDVTLMQDWGTGKTFKKIENVVTMFS